MSRGSSEHDRPSTTLCRHLSIEPLEARLPLALDFSLVADIAPGEVNASSYPGMMRVVGDVMYFQASIPTATGDELWRTDGTAAGTALVKDIRPGPQSSGVRYLTNVNGRLFFTANDGSNGVELWTSDGTAAGTHLLKDLRPGVESSNPRYLTYVGGALYFIANDGTSGRSLWRSDGTSAGTMLFDAPVPEASPQPFGVLADTLYYAGSTVLGVELLRVEPGASTAVLVKDSVLALRARIRRI